MAVEIKAPNHYPRDNHLIFLAGSIDMGKAENWQQKVIQALQEFNITVLNPRRDDWDSSWEQTAENPEFNKQVNWEQDALNAANLIVFMMTKKSKAPITLMELGLHIDDDVMVCCEEGFYRRGNVEILCQRFGVPLYDELDILIKDLKTLLNDQGFARTTP